MICANCHAENPGSNRFCGNCGQPLNSLCSNCGSDNAPGQRFCGNCGTALGGTPAASTPAPTSTTERRLVTVLFADLTGYTSFAEGRDSEDTRRFLGSYFDRSREIIERFGGIVEKFIGDAVMAVWGVSVAHEDDAERAVRAGFELVDIVAKLSADEGAPNLALRVGVNTGEAAVGPGQDHMGFVTGDLVNTASRLESAADPGSVLVGEVTMNAASRAIAFESAGEQALKGKSLPVPAWKALRVVSEVGGRGRAQSLEPPFVGRADELRLLKDLLATVGRDSKARLVSLVGEAGIGKSRLVWEFLKYLDGLVEDTYWHEGRSPSYGDGVTFWAVAEMIRRRAGILENDPDDMAEAKLAKTLETYVPDPGTRAWMQPRVSAVLGIGDAPQGDRAELDAAIRAFFEGVAAKGTTVLVFEDLHWADTALLDFVDELTDWWRDKPILVITMARPDLLERRPAWGTGRQGVISATLGLLNDAEMTQMVKGTVPGLPDSAVGTIVERAAGVPLYAVELLRSLIAQGDIEGDAGDYRVVGDLSEIAVPESLQAVIGARLDRLDPADRTLIQDAAVLGHAFSLEGLSVVTGESKETLEQRLHKLTRQELIEPVRDFLSPEMGQYRFLQGLIRDVALGRMSKEARRGRHLAVAAHMESQLDPEIAVVVASHYLQALEATGDGPDHDQIKEKALQSVAAAANRAADLSSWEQVISISMKGLELSESDHERAGFWEHLLTAHMSQAERDLAEKYGQMALDYHKAEGGAEDTWRLMHKIGLMFIALGQRDRAVQLLSGLIESHAELDHPELAKAAIVFCRASMLQGLTVGDVMDRAIAAAEKLEVDDYLIDGLITKASYADIDGRLTEARILLEGAIALADQANLTQVSARGRNNLAFLFGSIDEALSDRVSREALETARRSGTRALILWHLSQEGFAHALYGRFDAMKAINDDPMWLHAHDDALATRRFYESQAALLRGDLGEAGDLLAESEAMSDQKDPQAMAWIRSGEMSLDLFAGHPEKTLATLNEFNGADWFRVQPVAWPLTTAAAVSGDRDSVIEVVELLSRYHPRFPRERNFLVALAEIGAATEAPLAEIDQMIANALEPDMPFVRMVYLSGTANFLPGDHPKKQDYLEEARKRAEEWELRGFLPLIDQFVT